MKRFYWDSDLYYQAFEQCLSMPNLPPLALAHVWHETTWQVQLHRETRWTEADAKLVGMGEMVCPHCHGRGELKRPYRGVKTGIRISRSELCMCGLWKRYYPHWCNPANVGGDYRSVAIDNLENYAGNLNGFRGEKLVSLLETVRKYEHNCYLLAGPSGTGKTTLMTGMYQRALAKWAWESFEKDVATPAVWKITASTLAKQFRDWEMKDAGRDADTGKPTLPPEVTVVKVHAALRAGFVPCLFVDELDKIKLDSDFQAKEFSAVIDVIQSNGGQVVAASNLSDVGLKHALGEQYGPAVIRRLIGARLNPEKPEDPADKSRGGFLIDFYNGKIRFNVANPELLEWSGEKRETAPCQKKPWAGAGGQPSKGKVFNPAPPPRQELYGYGTASSIGPDTPKPQSPGKTRNAAFRKLAK
jgi:hypothetical protein